MRFLHLRKFSLLAVLGGAFSIGLGSPGHAEELGYFNWSDYTPEDVVSGFEDENGVSVIHDTYSEGDTAETMLHAGNSGYDVAVVSMEVAERLRLGGSLARIDDSRLPNAAGVDAALMERFYEQHPGARGYIQPFLWGYTGLAFDRAKVVARIPDAPFDSWALLFDPGNAESLADCGVYVINSPEEVAAIALAYLGRNPNSQDPRDINDALEVIAAISPYVRDLESEHYDVLAAGEACLALTWNTEAISVIIDEERPGLELFVPKEGTNLWLDGMVIPSDAPHPDLAHEFINYALRPETGALLADWNYTPSAVSAARSLMDQSTAGDPRVWPHDDALDHWFVTRAFSPDQKTDLNHRWWRAFLGI